MKQRIVIERGTDNGWWVVAEGDEQEVWLPRTWLPEDVDVDTVLACDVTVDTAAQEALRCEVAALRRAVTADETDK